MHEHAGPRSTHDADSRAPVGRAVPAARFAAGSEPGRSGGSALPAALAMRASAAFSQDFSDVRLHSAPVPGDQGAFGGALGRDVYLSPALAHAPAAISHVVLAHELAHVAQQARWPSLAGDFGSPSALEADADRGAWSLLHGDPADVLAAPLRLQRCVGPGRPTGTAITPAHFRFRTIVPIRPGDGDPAGWRAAAIRASMSKDVGGSPYGATTCAFEVGVPLRTHEGTVSEAQAQIDAAAAANTAAYHVLSSMAPVSASTCIAFREEMQFLLGLQIPGARVSAIIHHDLPVVNFP
jgi:hypothetical protein